MNSKRSNRKLHPELYSYMSYSRLFPKIKPSFSHLTDDLKKFDLIEIILVLAKINILMSERKYAVNQSFQQFLYKHFLNDYHRERVHAFLKKEGDRFLLFHNHQLLFLLKNAFLNCGKLPNIDFKIPVVMKRFGKCCLLANDFLYLTGIDRERLDEMDAEEKREAVFISIIL